MIGRTVALGFIASALMGCLQFDYILQAAEGQLELACNARSIESVIANESVDPATRAMLAEIPHVKAFGQRHGLLPTDDYADFVGLDRDSVVYVVTAAPELSLQAETFWFPIVGSVPYLGYFDRHRAENQAKHLKNAGFDVHVRGARAYSTLGWFEDPVLSSMLGEGDGAMGDLANTILHESVHATTYVPGQSEFNEGLATFLADRLTPLWLTERYGAQAPELHAYLSDEADSKRIRGELADTYSALEKLYASRQSDSVKRKEKRRILEDAQGRLELSGPLNNARLSAYDAYSGPDAHFSNLYVACGRNLKRTLEAAKRATEADFKESQQSNLGPLVTKLAATCRTK